MSQLRCDIIIRTTTTDQADEVDDDENNILSNKPERVCMIERWDLQQVVILFHIWKKNRQRREKKGKGNSFNDSIYTCEVSWETTRMSSRYANDEFVWSWKRREFSLGLNKVMFSHYPLLHSFSAAHLITVSNEFGSSSTFEVFETISRVNGFVSSVTASLFVVIALTHSLCVSLGT